MTNVNGELPIYALGGGAPSYAASTREPRTLPIRPRRKTRGWLVQRALLAADVIGIAAAFAIAEAFFGATGRAWWAETLLFCGTLPAWVVVAKLYELYDHDEERTEHTTVDDLFGVFHLVTVGAWTFFIGSWATGFADPKLQKLAAFWLIAIALVAGARAGARAFCRRSPLYLQNTLIVGGGEIGQLVARKFRQHAEYRINLLGFVDDDPKILRPDLRDVPLLGSLEQLPRIVTERDVDRVVVAFSRDSHRRTLELLRVLKPLDVQIDIVPRLFEIVGPNTALHRVEGLPLVGLPAPKLFPFSRTLKRLFDVAVASVALAATSPFFAYAAWRIRRESPGPVFFRQTRLGLGMREFTALKFRTMQVDTDQNVHREYIKSLMDAGAAPQESGLYKLDRGSAITPFGHFLRKTSLDELPQLVNVLRGDMSLVGPRPCIPYETENFEPHHFERFLVPGGITGLWQVTARAHSTFGEALEMDVTYARNWSLGLDLTLLCRTPFQILRQRKGTA